MVYNATLQGNTKQTAIERLKISIVADKDRGGFSWAHSKEGFMFWYRVTKLDFKVYYEKYSVCNGTYIIEDEHKIPGFTAEIPFNIKQEIIKIIARLGKLDQIYENNALDLFIWSDTLQGLDYWRMVYLNYFCSLQKTHKIYKTYNELFGHTLKYRDQVYFNDNIYIVEKTYLRNTKANEADDVIFKELNINKCEFCPKLYGYNLAQGTIYSYCPVNGIWFPFKSEDYEAATRVCLELFKIIEGKETKVLSSIDKQIINEIKNNEIKFSANEFRFLNIKKKKVRF